METENILYLYEIEMKNKALSKYSKFISVINDVDNQNPPKA